MVDLVEALEVAAYVSFVLGAAFAVWQLRIIRRDRGTQLVTELYSDFCEPDMIEAWSKIVRGEFKDGADMERKCSYQSLVKMAGFYEGIGFLVRKKLVDANLVLELMPIQMVWDKMRPWVMMDRARTGPLMWEEFEWVAGRSRERYARELRRRGIAARTRPSA